MANTVVPTSARWTEHHTVRFPSDVYELLQQRAEDQQRSTSSVIREAVAAFLVDKAVRRG